MKSISTNRVVVGMGGNQVASFVGLNALGALADKLGLGEALSSAIPWNGNGIPLHDRGKVLIHQMLVLAAGGEACSDIEYLRVEKDLFQDVCSDSTLYRTFTKSLDEDTLIEVSKAFALVRGKVWNKAELLKGKDPIYLDIDASLVEVHSENKEETGPNYKKGFGFHPMFVTSPSTGEVLSSILRPGNATANDASDQLSTVDLAINQLPEPISFGHRLGDEVVPSRKLVVRADSAGQVKEFLWGLNRRNIHFSVMARRTPQVTEAVSMVADKEKLWKKALNKDGKRREKSAICEVTHLVDLKDFPPNTRLIIRREPLHKGGIEKSLFPHLEFRFVGFLTDQKGDIKKLDLIQREHASVEDTIGRLKDTGLNKFPFNDFHANCAWMKVVTFAHDLVRWFQLLCLEGSLKSAEPKTLRFRLWQMPARKVNSARRIVLKLLSTWPDAEALLQAHQKIVLLT